MKSKAALWPPVEAQFVRHAPALQAKGAHDIAFITHCPPWQTLVPRVVEDEQVEGEQSALVAQVVRHAPAVQA